MACTCETNELGDLLPTCYNPKLSCDNTYHTIALGKPKTQPKILIQLSGSGRQ